MWIIDKIKEFFHKINVGLERKAGDTLPRVSEEKEWGSMAEDQTYQKLRYMLPDAKIFKNVCLDSKKAKGEIDFLIVYDLKVFVIELKCWKGRIYQDGDIFYKEKDSYEETFTKELRSPIRQLNGNIYKLKQKFNNIWFEKALLFLESESVSLEDDDFPYFTDIYNLIDYIKNEGEQNKPYAITYLLNNIKQYDLIISKGLWSGKEKHCIIDPYSLNFTINGTNITKNQIDNISISHNFSYDELRITLKNKNVLYTTEENKTILYIDNNQTYSVSTSKIDYIKIN